MKIIDTEILCKLLPMEISGSEQQNASEIRNFEAPKIFDFLGTLNKTQRVSDFKKFQFQEINLKIKIK